MDKCNEDLEVISRRASAQVRRTLNLPQVAATHPRSPSALPYTRPRQGCTVAAVWRLFNLLGAVWGRIAVAAAHELLYIRSMHRETFIEWLRQLRGAPADLADQEQLLDLARREEFSSVIRAFYYDDSVRNDISPQEAVRWLRPRTKVWVVVSTPRLRVSVAKVEVPDEKPFKAAWLQITPRDHILLVSLPVEGDDFLDAVEHELMDHFCVWRHGT